MLVNEIKSIYNMLDLFNVVFQIYPDHSSNSAMNIFYQTNSRLFYALSIQSLMHKQREEVDRLNHSANSVTYIYYIVFSEINLASILFPILKGSRYMKC